MEEMAKKQTHSRALNLSERQSLVSSHPGPFAAPPSAFASDAGSPSPRARRLPKFHWCVGLPGGAKKGTLQPAIFPALPEHQPPGSQFTKSQEVFLLEQLQAIPLNRIRSLKLLPAGQSPRTGENYLLVGLRQYFPYTPPHFHGR